jgi:hypothetical protein
MKIDKNQIFKNHCYTELVYERRNKKLGTNFSNEESEILIKKILKETDVEYFQKKGKNFYITSEKHNITITINSNTFRVITVDKCQKT